MGLSYFIKTKDQIASCVDDYIGQARSYGHHVSILRCNNAGENKIHLQKLARTKRIRMEYTSPYSLQMKVVVKKKNHSHEAQEPSNAEHCLNDTLNGKQTMGRDSQMCQHD